MITTYLNSNAKIKKSVNSCIEVYFLFDINVKITHKIQLYTELCLSFNSYFSIANVNEIVMFPTADFQIDCLPITKNTDRSFVKNLLLLLLLVKFWV